MAPPSNHQSSEIPAETQLFVAEALKEFGLLYERRVRELENQMLVIMAQKQQSLSNRQIAGIVAGSAGGAISGVVALVKALM